MGDPNQPPLFDNVDITTSSQDNEIFESAVQVGRAAELNVNKF